jgi:gas vesicle protein
MGRLADVHGRHPLAMGILTGTAVGACLGVLFAPRRGSDTRRRVGQGVNQMVSSTSSGYRRAKGSVGHWANRGHGAYVATRDRVVKGAKGTSQYVRGVADAVTNKAHRESDSALRKVSPSPSAGLAGQPRKAI